MSARALADSRPATCNSSSISSKLTQVERPLAVPAQSISGDAPAGSIVQSAGHYSTARIIAKMLSRIASRSFGHASATAAKSGSFAGISGSMALLLARWLPETSLFPGVLAGTAVLLGIDAGDLHDTVVPRQIRWRIGSIHVGRSALRDLDEALRLVVNADLADARFIRFGF